jgi:S1-C subfamily serine protease
MTQQHKSKLILLTITIASIPTRAASIEIPPAVRASEAARIAIIEKITPGVVCIYDEGQRGGGSGLLINEQGYGLTNYHVVAPMLQTRKGLGGLSDGETYELEVLGIDPQGDVAMFRLKGLDKFPYVQLGDSDNVKVGDPAIAVGNPFTIAEDHTPTVTYGIITGTHRYQWGSGSNLIYADCLQTNASINPGNSGGPLFNEQGQVIGINGRISINDRGRYNVGFGYAITINQVKRFMPLLAAGKLARHGTMQALVNEDLRFNEMLDHAPAWEAGIRPGDRLIRFADRKINSLNEYVSLLELYPENWPVPVTYEHNPNQSNAETRNRLVRLEPVDPKLRGEYKPNPTHERDYINLIIEQFKSAIDFQPEDANDDWEWNEDVFNSDIDYLVTWSPRKHSRQPIGDHLTHRGTGHITVPQLDEYAKEALMTLPMLVMDDTFLRPPSNNEESPKSPNKIPGRFTGADAVIQLDDNGTILYQKQLQTITVNFREHTEAVYGFNFNTGLLQQIVVTYKPLNTGGINLGAGVTITIEEYADTGSFLWPKTLRLDAPGETTKVSINNLNPKAAK